MTWPPYSTSIPRSREQRRYLVDLEARVVRVADVRERVDAPTRHPRDEFAVVAQMQLEAVGEAVVPGHDVGHECAALEGGRDAPWLHRGEAGGIDSRIRWRDAGRELRAELFEQVRSRVDQSALGPGTNCYRVGAARDVEAVAFECDWRWMRRDSGIAESDPDFGLRHRRIRGRFDLDAEHRGESARQIASSQCSDLAGAAEADAGTGRRGIAFSAHLSGGLPIRSSRRFSGGSGMIT